MANKVLFSNLGNSPKDKIINIVIIIVVLVALFFLIRYVWKQAKLYFSDARKDLDAEIGAGGKLTYKQVDYVNKENFR